MINRIGIRFGWLFLLASPIVSSCDKSTIELALDNGYISIESPDTVMGSVTGSISFLYQEARGVQTIDIYQNDKAPRLPAKWKTQQQNDAPFSYTLYVARLGRGTDVYRLIVKESNWQYWFTFHNEETFAKIIESYGNSSEKGKDCE